MAVSIMKPVFAVLVFAVTVLPAAAQTTETTCKGYNQEFSIYFEAQSIEIVKSGRAVIDQAVANLANAPSFCKVGTIKIDAHTDTAGSEKRNDFLSRAIGQNLFDLFTAMGFSADQIKVTAHGEKSPAKATRDDVRSPLNRRAEIKFTLTSQ